MKNSNVVYRTASKMIKHVPGTKTMPINFGLGGLETVEGYWSRTYEKQGKYTWTCVSEHFVAYPVEVSI